MLYRRQRSRYWWVRFTAPDGAAVRRSTKTADKRLAQEYEDTLKATLWRQVKLGDRPAYQFHHAVERWLTEKAHLKSIADQKLHLRWLLQQIDPKIPLLAIARETVAGLKTASVGVSNATINRRLEVLRAVLRAARDEWGWLDKAPPVAMLPEPTRRIRWLTTGEAERLLAELPQHLRDMARFSLETGLREKNVCRLKWADVDLKRGVLTVHGDQHKSKKPLGVALSQGATTVLKGRPHRKGYVFLFEGHPVTKCNTAAWRKALKRAGIREFRWHDLRHTWASWHVQNGTPLHVLQEMGGWHSFEMVRRYAHLAPEHLAPYTKNLPNLRTLSGTLTKRGKTKTA
jgi:integrase